MKNRPKGRMFLFPYAGGSAMSYSVWKDCTEYADIVPLEYPGRGVKADQKSSATIQELAENLIAELLDLSINGADVLFGHSMGAIVCWHVAMNLQSRYNIVPRKIVISAAKNPFAFSKIEEHEFIQSVLSNGRIPAEVNSSSYFRENVLRIIEADAAMIKTYVPPKQYEKLIASSLLLCYEEDIVSYDDLSVWNKFFAKESIVQTLRGGHFGYEEKSERRIIEDIIWKIG